MPYENLSSKRSNEARDYAGTPEHSQRSQERSSARKRETLFRPLKETASDHDPSKKAHYQMAIGHGLGQAETNAGNPIQELDDRFNRQIDAMDAYSPDFQQQFDAASTQYQAERARLLQHPNDQAGSSHGDQQAGQSAHPLALDLLGNATRPSEYIRQNIEEKKYDLAKRYTHANKKNETQEAREAASEYRRLERKYKFIVNNQHKPDFKSLLDKYEKLSDRKKR